MYTVSVVAMIDILFCAKGRPEFTAASAEALRVNTAWGQVESVWVYSDGDHNVAPLLAPLPMGCIVPDNVGGPVASLLLYLERAARYYTWSPEDQLIPEIVCKIDNDVIVPPGWLEQCLAVMEAHPALDLLGIEPPQSRTANPQTGKRGDEPDRVYCPWTQIGYERTESIGGVGLFRRRAFDRFPDLRAEGTYGGFTSWQLRHPELVIGWIVPPLKLFLLDRLPMDPWKALSRRYIAEKQQRPWTDYSLEAAQELAGWWLDGR